MRIKVIPWIVYFTILIIVFVSVWLVYGDMACAQNHSYHRHYSRYWNDKKVYDYGVDVDLGSLIRAFGGYKEYYEERVTTYCILGYQCWESPCRYSPRSYPGEGCYKRTYYRERHVPYGDGGVRFYYRKYRRY